MKYYETTCTEYIAASKRINMHPELETVYAEMPESLSHLGNMIFYGPSGAGKYTQFLRSIEKYAVAGLKTEKMAAETDKQKYEYHISDIHYEIDLALLGCESKKLWNECFFQIVDVVSAKQSKSGIILCKNFQSIHSELLDVFYSYMQHCRALSIHIVFVLLTEHVSFIPNRILQCCKLIPVKRPPAELYEKNTTSHQHTTISKTHKLFLQQIHPKTTSQISLDVRGLEGISPDSLLNIKEMHSIAKVASPPKEVFNIICDNIIDKMRNHETLDIISFRDNLYDILLYGLDVTECLWYILYYFVESEIFVDESGEVLSEIMDKMNAFLKFYNNNYRPIYHLESMFIYLITKVYKYPTIADEPKTST